MPNWVTAKLKIDGPNASEVMKGLLSKNQYDEVVFDFNKIKPMPKTLNLERSNLTDMCEKLYTNKITYAEMKKYFHSNDGYVDKDLSSMMEVLGITDKLSHEEQCRKVGQALITNKKLYGEKDWYEWSIANWGTKWNACHNDYDERTPNETKFDTAWSDVRKLICELSKLYPKNIFYYDYSEEQIGIYTGSASFQNGEVLSNVEYKDLSKEAYEHSFKLWGESVKDWFEFDDKENTYKLKEQSEDEEEME